MAIWWRKGSRYCLGHPAPCFFFSSLSLISPGSDDESAQFPLVTPGRHLLTLCFGGM